MEIKVPTRQVQTGTQWQSQYRVTYYNLNEATTAESMLNSAEINLTHSAYEGMWVQHSGTAPFFQHSWHDASETGTSYKYFNQFIVSENTHLGKREIDDLKVTSPTLPAGIDRVVPFSNGSTTAHVTAYANTIPGADIRVNITFNVNHPIDVKTGSGNIPVQSPYSNVIIHTANPGTTSVESYEQNEDNVYVKVIGRYDVFQGANQAPNSTIVTAAYDYTTRYASATGSQYIYYNKYDIKDVYVYPNASVGTLVNWSYNESASPWPAISYTIEGEEKDIGRQGYITYKYDSLESIYTTYANVRFNDVLVNYINFNGKRYP